MSIATTTTRGFKKTLLDAVGQIVKDNDDYQYILTLQCELSTYVEA